MEAGSSAEIGERGLPAGCLGTPALGTYTAAWCCPLEGPTAALGPGPNGFFRHLPAPSRLWWWALRQAGEPETQ